MLMLRHCGVRSQGIGVETGVLAQIQGESRECSASRDAHSAGRSGFFVARTATTTNAGIRVGSDHLREYQTLVAV